VGCGPAGGWGWTRACKASRRRACKASRLGEVATNLTHLHPPCASPPQLQGQQAEVASNPIHLHPPCASPPQLQGQQAEVATNFTPAAARPAGGRGHARNPHSHVSNTPHPCSCKTSRRRRPRTAPAWTNS